MFPLKKYSPNHLFFRKGSDAGDHPPITPMRSASESELGHEAWRLYDLITRHFIATVNTIENLIAWLILAIISYCVSCVCKLYING